MFDDEITQRLQRVRVRAEQLVAQLGADTASAAALLEAVRDCEALLTTTQHTVAPAEPKRRCTPPLLRPQARQRVEKHM